VGDDDQQRQAPEAVDQKVHHFDKLEGKIGLPG
jgi:hypothetical protein